MAVEKIEGAIVITGPHIQLARMITLRQMLKLEAMGLRSSRGSALQAVKRLYGFRGSRAKVLEQLNELIEATGRNPETPEVGQIQ